MSDQNKPPPPPPPPPFPSDSPPPSQAPTRSPSVASTRRISQDVPSNESLISSVGAEEVITIKNPPVETAVLPVSTQSESEPTFVIKEPPKITQNSFPEQKKEPVIRERHSIDNGKPTPPVTPVLTRAYSSYFNLGGSTPPPPFPENPIDEKKKPEKPSKEIQDGGEPRKASNQDKTKKKPGKAGTGKPKKEDKKTSSSKPKSFADKEVKISDKNDGNLRANYRILLSGSESESEASSIDGDSVKKVEILSEHETSVFHAVLSGSVVTAKELLESIRFDFNKKNAVEGYTILHIAIRRQDEEMVGLILNLGSESILACVLEDVLLHAIKEESLDLVRTLLREMDRRGIVSRKEELKHRKLLKNYMAHMSQYHPEAEFQNSEFHEDITPLLFSAICDSYELVELFHKRGHVLRKPHEYLCSCNECKNIGQLMKSLRRLHVYQACSKPAYICYIANHHSNSMMDESPAASDPILTAFTLIQKVRECAQEEVFSNEYIAIEAELEAFACQLLQQCKNTKEIEMVLAKQDGYYEDSPLPRLSMATEMKLKDFIAHTHTQQILSRWWSGKDWPEWKSKGIVTALFYLVIRIPFWPFISLYTTFDRSSQYGRILSCPASSCLNSIAAYICLLVLLFIMNVWNPDGPNHRGLPRTGLEYVVMAWVAGHWLSIARSTLRRFKSYYSDEWAYYDLITNSLFVVAFVFWFIAPTEPKLDRQHWKKNDFTLLAEIAFASASIMCFSRMLRVLQLIPKLGTLIISVVLMVYDVLKMGLFFVVIILGFSLGLTRLYRPYSNWSDVDDVTGEEITQPEAFSSFTNTVEALFWGIFAMGSRTDANIIPRTIVSINEPTVNATNHLTFTEHIGKSIFAAYHVIVALTLLNMLLGFMSRTYEFVTEEDDREWKFERTKMWLSYGMDFVNPPPLNFIPSIAAFLSLFKKKPSRRSKKNNEYHKLMKLLILRYFRDRTEVSQDDPLSTEALERLAEDIAELQSLIEQVEKDHYDRKTREIGQPPTNLDTSSAHRSSSESETEYEFSNAKNVHFKQRKT